MPHTLRRGGEFTELGLDPLSLPKDRSLLHEVLDAAAKQQTQIHVAVRAPPARNNFPRLGRRS